MYVTDQPAFLNAVIGGYALREPHALLAITRSIERAHGRDHARGRDKGPRPLDIDVLLYGNLITDDPELTIPHPGLCERRFVLEPLLEIAPDLVHPSTGVPLRRVLDSLSDQGVYCYQRASYNERASKEHHS
jgi:2-amino-4-hydroxy-6-hydroxymethyldihydropteridine diphosphokinase